MYEGAQLAHWLEERVGKLTASRMHDAMAYLKGRAPTIRWECADCGGKNDANKGQSKACKHCGSVRPPPPPPEPAEARNRYMRELLAERLTQLNIRHFVTDAMEHGLEFEADAVTAYEMKTGALVIRQPGFFDHPRIAMCGASPDGFVDANGLVEAKCPTSTTFIEWRLGGVVPEERKPQMALQLACTRRRWCDFVAFDPRVKDRRLQTFIRRYEPTAEEIAKVEKEAERFLAELDAAWEQLITAEVA